MTNCRFTQGRIVPISYNEKEDFKNINPEYFFLCEIISGYAVAKINGQIFHIPSNSILAFPHNNEIELLASYNLQAVSVSFAPEFINISLNWDFIESADYPSKVAECNYPEFDLFYERNMIYSGVLPFDDITRINDIFLDIITQIKNQPTGKWSCTARSHVFNLFMITEHSCHKFMEGGERVNSLEEQVLDHINSNFNKQITISGLCKKFHTNRTTLSRKFKALTNSTIDDYIIDKRISMAKYDLDSTSLNIYVISKSCGFGDGRYTYFSTMFKKRVGMSPRKYRNEMRNRRPKEEKKIY